MTEAALSKSTVPLELPGLFAFVEVADRGSFTEAARSLGRTQPALSVAVRKLEEHLGVTLLFRGRKSVTLTEPGRLLLGGARAALGVLAETHAQLCRTHMTPQGRVRLGCHESLGGYALPGFLAPFLRQYPDIELLLSSGPSRDIERAVIDGRIDLALVVNPSHHPDSVVVTLFRDSVELLAARGLSRGRDPRAVLAESPLVFVPELVQSQHVLTGLRRRRMATGRHLTCSSLDLVKSLVLGGVGVGILPRRVARHGVRRGEIVVVGPAMPHHGDTIALVRRHDLPASAAIRATVEHLKAHGAVLAGEPALD